MQYSAAGIGSGLRDYGQSKVEVGQPTTSLVKGQGRQSDSSQERANILYVAKKSLLS